MLLNLYGYLTDMVTQHLQAYMVTVMLQVMFVLLQCYCKPYLYSCSGIRYTQHAAEGNFAVT